MHASKPMTRGWQDYWEWNDKPKQSPRRPKRSRDSAPMAGLATTFGPVVIQDQSTSGKRNSSAQRQTAQNRLQARNGLRGDRNAAEQPANCGLLGRLREIRRSRDCVVVDAVTVEPVSGLQHPAGIGKDNGKTNVAA